MNPGHASVTYERDRRNRTTGTGAPSASEGIGGCRSLMDSSWRRWQRCRSGALFFQINILFTDPLIREIGDPSSGP